MDRKLLLGAVLVPIVYFGIQLVTAPFFPGYSLVRDAASLLGSDRAEHAVWFNLGAAASGICAIAGGFGIFRALRPGGPTWLRFLIPFALLLLGCGNIWAGTFTIPDPRHAANPFAPAYFAMPLLLCLAGWVARDLRGQRIYLSLNLLLFVALVPVMAGFTAIDRGAYGGLLQRILAFAVMMPIGVLGWHLLRKPRS